ncbi:unnamed protein product [Merluccius merluccius]
MRGVMRVTWSWATPLLITMVLLRLAQCEESPMVPGQKYEQRNRSSEDTVGYYLHLQTEPSSSSSSCSDGGGGGREAARGRNCLRPRVPETRPGGRFCMRKEAGLKEKEPQKRSCLAAACLSPEQISSKRRRDPDSA